MHVLVADVAGIVPAGPIPERVEIPKAAVGRVSVFRIRITTLGMRIRIAVRVFA